MKLGIKNKVFIVTGGAKGIGETVMVPTAPAIANAIYHALGVRIKELPITPEKILKALREKQSNKDTFTSI